MGADTRIIAGVRTCHTFLPGQSSPTIQPTPHFAEALGCRALLFAAVSDESERDAVARAVLAELAEEILDGVDRLVVEAGDDVAGLEASPGGRGAVPPPP
jgi:hypothetical protein